MKRSASSGSIWHLEKIYLFSEYEILGLYITPIYYLYSEILYIKD